MKYSVKGPKGVILASGLTLRQAENYCANCGGEMVAENPAKSLNELSKSQLDRLDAANDKKFQAALDAVIGAGYGNLTFSDMRAMPSPPDVVRKYLDAADEASAIQFERRSRREYHGTQKPIKRGKNPLQKGIVKYDDGAEQNYRFHVEYKMSHGETWQKHAAFNDSAEAVAFAKSHSRKHPARSYRVVDQFI